MTLLIWIVAVWAIGLIPHYAMAMAADPSLRLQRFDCTMLAIMWPITWILSYIGFFRANWR